MAKVIRIWPDKVGVVVGEDGDPQITLVEGPNDAYVIEIRAGYWAAFVDACQRLKGVGIGGKESSGVVVIEGDDAEQVLRAAKANGGS